MKTAIIGLGLIGGSLSLALRDRHIATQVWGVDSSPSNAAEALRLGLADRIVTLDDAVVWADLVVIATPVDSIPSLAVRILNRTAAHQTVIDVGSTKEELCEMVRRHPMRPRLVATHPMWGTEYSGPSAAIHGAFEGRTAVVCEKESSAPDALEQVENMYRDLGMTISYMGAEEQDMHCAYVSHISHITSFALALTVLEKEREDERIFDLAGGGFESTVRLAKSSPETWVPILMQNKYNVLDVLREHIHQLQIIRKTIEQSNLTKLTEIIQHANSIKRIIK